LTVRWGRARLHAAAVGTYCSDIVNKSWVVTIRQTAAPTVVTQLSPEGDSAMVTVKDLSEEWKYFRTRLSEWPVATDGDQEELVGRFRAMRDDAA
jgi:hypothetical protein